MLSIACCWIFLFGQSYSIFLLFHMCHVVSQVPCFTCAMLFHMCHVSQVPCYFTCAMFTIFTLIEIIGFNVRDLELTLSEQIKICVVLWICNWMSGKACIVYCMCYTTSAVLLIFNWMSGKAYVVYCVCYTSAGVLCTHLDIACYV